MIRTSLLSLAAVSLLGAGLIAGCGGGGGDEDPQEVLDETFSNDETINSGVLDLSLSVSAEGEEGGSFDATLSGPFQGAENEFPQLDLTATVSGEGGGQSIDFEGGLITTADQAFVSYQDTTYEIPQPFYDQLKSLSEQAQQQTGTKSEDSGAVLEQLGIDPSEWVSEPENEGDEDVEGTETIHIHADANVPRIIENLQSVSERTGGALELDQLTAAEDAIDDASIDVYSGKDDRILRRLDLNLGITPPENDASGVDSVDLGFSLTLGGVNEEQTIEAPSDAQPFSQLESDLGLPPGLLQGALGDELGGGVPGGGSLGGGSLGGGGGIEGAQGAGSQKYLDCISQAQTAEELQACNQ